MTDWYVVLTPVLVLAILLLFRFVGCNEVLGLGETVVEPPLSIGWEGKIRDRVGQTKLALAPDGALDGAVIVRVRAEGDHTVVGLRLESYPQGGGTPVGTWDTDVNSTYFVLGASAALDDPLLNDTANSSVTFPVTYGDT